MAYTADRTWVTGEAVTAAYFNTYMRANLKWLSTDKPMCRGYDATNMSAGVEEAIGIENRVFDNASMLGTSQEATDISTPAAGKYLVGGTYSFSSSPGTAAMYVRCRVNGTTYIGGNSAVPDSSNAFTSFDTLYAFVATDYFEMMGYVGSGETGFFGALADYSPHTWAMWVAV